ncbi:MAG: SCO family protein [Pseudomonadota bacterium]
MSKAVIEHCGQTFFDANGIERGRESASQPAAKDSADHCGFNDAGALDRTGLPSNENPGRPGLHRRLKHAGIWALFLLFAAALPLLGKGRTSDYGLAVKRAAPSFILSDSAGRQVSLADFGGRFVYLMFGYLNCPDVCHTQALLFEELNLAAGTPEDLAFVFVAIDPERDKPESVHAYFDERGSGFISLHGNDITDLQSLALQYHASFRRQPGEPDGTAYLIDHTGLFYLLGPDGRLRYTYAANQNATPRLLGDLTQLRTEYELL